MRPVAVGLVEILLIQSLDVGVLVRFTQFHTLIGVIYGLCAFCANVGGISRISVLNGLSAAVYATAGASHNFDEVIISLTRFDKVHKGFCVFQAGRDGNLDFGIFAVDGKHIFRFLNSFDAAHCGEVDLVLRFSGKDVLQGTESRFHNAARYAEDKTCARADAERHVVFFVGKVVEQNTFAFNKSCKFPSGQDVIDVGNARRALEGTTFFKLFGGTRHNGYYADFFRGDTEFFCVIGFAHRAEHLLRRFAGRKVGDKFGIIMFHKLNPAGRAGSHHRQHAAVRNSSEELIAFFHNGKVGGEVYVEYVVEAEAS